jgi:hypothetical protein
VGKLDQREDDNVEHGVELVVTEVGKSDSMRIELVF